MSKETAEHWVVISALVVAAVYAYRRIVEPVSQGNVGNVIGLGNPVPLAQWATAWGFVYFLLAVVTEAAPGLGGSFAILIATGDVLANAPAILPDVTKQEQVGKLAGQAIGKGAGQAGSGPSRAGQGAASGISSVAGATH
jgi:hypothetical protein